MHVLLTRPQAEAERSAKRLRAMKHEVSVVPLLETQSLIEPSQTLNVGHARSLVVTSIRALHVVGALPQWEVLARFPIFAVGPRTAELARSMGAGDVRCGGGDLTRLLRVIVDAAPEGEILYLAGQERTGDLPILLGGYGLSCRMIEVYRVVKRTQFTMDIGMVLRQRAAIDWSLVYSRRSAEALYHQARACGALKALGRIGALSAKAGAPFESVLPVWVADEPNENSLFELLKAR